MKPSDIAALTSVEDPQLSPDGCHVAYVVTRVDSAKNSYRSQIWVVGTDGSTASRALSSGEHRDSQPRWSPDGRQLAFTSSRAKDKQGKTRSTLHLLPFNVAGETVTLAESDEGFGDLAWSPDGNQLALTMRTRGDHYKNDDVALRPARKIDHLFFMLNGEGFITDRPQHVYVVPTDGSADMRNLTPGHAECSEPSWFPDGTRLAVAVNRFRNDFALDVGVVDMTSTNADDPDKSTLRLLTDATGVYSFPLVTPDGASVIVVGLDDPTVYPQNCHLGLLDAEEVGSPRWLTTAIDRTWDVFMAPQPPTWTAEGSLIAVAEDRGRIHLFQVAGDGSTPERIFDGDLSVTGWSSGQIDSKPAITYTATSITEPSELFLWIDGETRPLTSVSKSFIASTQPRSAERFLAPSGDVEVDAWIYRPHDFDPAKKYPALLNIHGGPFAQYGDHFYDEFQMQAEAGYVVICSNPRGGSGRDSAWGQAILGPKHKVPGSGWGGVDYQDCMAVVDAALDRFDFIDEHRLGVLGGSYGGYLTNWIVTHTDRFAAACSERGVSNLLSLEYTSDAAGQFSTEIGVQCVDDPDEYMRMSPIKYVKDLNTPLLIMHSEDDLRCPLEQAMQLFTACQLLNKPDIEYWLFPGENHELSRSGSPAHRKQRVEIILDFLDRHLKTSV